MQWGQLDEGLRIDCWLLLLLLLLPLLLLRLASALP